MRIVMASWLRDPQFTRAIIIKPHRPYTTYVDAVYCHPPSTGLTDQDAVWVEDSGQRRI